VLPSRNITNALAIATAAFQLAGAAPSQNAEVVGSTAWRAGRLARRGRELQPEILVTLSHNWSSANGWLTLTVTRSVPTACDAGRTDMGRGILLWLLGVPIPVILLLAMCSHH
jgi:hypothetical protein